MKWLRFISVVMMCAVIVGCHSNRREKMYEEGVSWTLAEYRKSTIHDLKYELSFSIPEKKSEAVEGEIFIMVFSFQKAYFSFSSFSTSFRLMVSILDTPCSCMVTP